MSSTTTLLDHFLTPYARRQNADVIATQRDQALEVIFGTPAQRSID